MTARILVGDCRTRMAELPDSSVHCCVTSPPYFGLRDYGVAGQMGLEPTPDAYVENLVEVFRGVRRVLRDDGTLWLNLGDSYCNSNGYARAQPEYQRKGRNDAPANDRDLSKLHEAGFKTKDLIGIPWRVAFALQADGWYLRQDIIWHKPNPMPESVRDRCTKAHEYLFLMAKADRYYFDGKAIKEIAVGGVPGNIHHKHTSAYESGDDKARTKAGLVAYAERQRSRRDSFKRDASKRAQAIPGQSVGTHRPDRAENDYDLSTRNRRSVWTVATRPFAGAHFATFPPALIEPCIMAGAPAGGTVLDPFGGAGTTGLVADRFGRNSILCELNPEYAEMARDRIEKDGCLFASVDIA